MKQKFIATFKQIDLFSKPVELLIRDEDSHKTIVGAMFSFAILVTVLTLAGS